MIDLHRVNENKERVFEEAILDNTNPTWAELGRVMAVAFRERLLLRMHTKSKEACEEPSTGVAR